MLKPRQTRSNDADRARWANGSVRSALASAGWSLVLVAIPLGIAGGLLALLGLVALTESRIAGIAGALALAAITGGLAMLGARLALRGSGLRRWLPRIVTGVTVAVVGTAGFLLLFAPTTGDGFLAMFASALGAIRCAASIREATDGLGLPARRHPYRRGGAPSGRHWRPGG